MYRWALASRLSRACARIARPRATNGRIAGLGNIKLGYRSVRRTAKPQSHQSVRSNSGRTRTDRSADRRLVESTIIHTAKLSNGRCVRAADPGNVAPGNDVLSGNASDPGNVAPKYVPSTTAAARANSNIHGTRWPGNIEMKNSISSVSVLW